MDELVDLIIEWQANAAQFVRDQFGVEPSPQQIKLLEGASRPGAHEAVKSGHGTGKTTALAWLVLWGLCCFEDVKVPCTAPTAHQLKDALWAEIRKWQGRMLEPWKSAIKVTSDEVKIEDLPGFAVARTGRKENPEALQGFHADEMIFVIDEASGIDDKVFEVARGALSTPKARVIMTANPTRTSGFFYKAFHANRERWATHTFSCEDSPLVARAYIEEMEEEYGRESDIFRVRVLGEFPAGGDLQFISAPLADGALGRVLPDNAYRDAPVVLGVDVAAYGGDRSVIVRRQGLYCDVLWTVVGVEPAVTSGIVAEMWDKHRADAVFIDEIGVGAGVVSNLRMMGRAPFGVNFGKSPTKSTYKNKRAECWDEMKQWLSVGQIYAPKWGERIKDELTGPDYCYDLVGKLQLERKEDMRARGLASPDFADALALTFAFPVKPNRIRDQMQREQEDYNPFEFKGA